MKKYKIYDKKKRKYNVIELEELNVFDPNRYNKI